MCDFPGLCLVNFEVNSSSSKSDKLGRERWAGVPVAQGEGWDGRADSSRVEQGGGADSLAPAASGQCVKERKLSSTLESAQRRNLQRFPFICSPFPCDNKYSLQDKLIFTTFS